MDWRIFHALNHALRGHRTAEDVAKGFNSVALFALVAAAGLLWFLARPSGSPRLKLATASAAASAALALAGNVVLGKLWHHDRPFVDHPRETNVLVRHGADNSFPSDHASAAFAVAFAVLAFDRLIGGVFLVAAVLIGLDRIFVGVHYPVDVATSALVGAGSAALMATLGRPWLERAVRLVSRLTDPVVAAARRLVTTRRAHRP